MNEVASYFHTDWAAMSFHDWLGLVITIVVFVVLVVMYVYIFHPANKKRFESHRHIPFHEGRDDEEEQR